MKNFSEFLKSNYYSCHYCDNKFTKQQLQKYFHCKCLFCVNCRDNIKEQLFKKFAYEYYINQYFDHIIINNYCRCLLCYSTTDYNKFTQLPKHSICKQTKKYLQLN